MVDDSVLLAVLDPSPLANMGVLAGLGMEFGGSVLDCRVPLIIHIAIDVTISKYDGSPKFGE